jgi:hypothetical protein
MAIKGRRRRKKKWKQLRKTPKEIEAEAVAENAPIAEEVVRGHSHPNANELQEKFDALVKKTEN